MAMIRTYTETYDMNTEKDCPTLLGIHTPIGNLPYAFLEPAFRMYRKYKYLGCDVTIVNSARLPVDPEQVGKIDGQNYVAPQDMLNPILFKGCHGESLGKVLDTMYDGVLSAPSGYTGFQSATLDKDVFIAALSNFYYTALGDDSWRKSPIQKTLSIRGLHPLVYELSTNHQILPTNGLAASNYRANNPVTPSNPTPLGDTLGAENGYTGNPAVTTTGWGSFVTGPEQVFDPATGTYSYKAAIGSMFTSKMHRLGWMDTMQFIGQNTPPSGGVVGTDNYQIAELPKLMMGMLLLPPANLCRQYLRVIIRHKFKFASFRTLTTGSNTPGMWNVFTQSMGYHDLITGNVPETKGVVHDPGDGTRTSQDLDREPIEGDEDD